MTDAERITLLLDQLDAAREAIANAQRWADKWKAYAFAMKAERDSLIFPTLGALQAKCDHKFIDSNHCLKCGWTPTPEDFPKPPRAAAG